MKPRAIVVPCYQSLKDPICEGLWLNYLKSLGKQGDFQIVLITLEQDHFSLSPDEQASTYKDLLTFNIEWHPISFKTSRYTYIFTKALMFASATWILIKSLYKKKVQAFLGFASLSGGIASVWAYVFRKELVIYCFEPHSQYQVEFGLWKKKSLSYSLLSRLERFQVLKANHLIVPTSYTKQLVENWGTKATINVMPVSVDENAFSILPEIGRQVRDELGIKQDLKVILYLGKFDGIYYSAKEIIGFYQHLYHLSDRYFFLTISPNNGVEINALFNELNVPSTNYLTLPPIDYSEVNKYINAADLGVLAVPSLPSQRFRTPIKTANYLLCGLPYLVNKGVAEDDLIAEKHHVGVVIDELSKEAALQAHNEIQNLLISIDLKERCRQTGLTYRKMSNTTDLLNSIFSKMAK